MKAIFIELPPFERHRKDYLTDESFRLFQQMLMANPEFYKNGEEAKNASIEYKELESKLESNYFRWGELTDQIEQAGRK